MGKGAEITSFFAFPPGIESDHESTRKEEAEEELHQGIRSFHQFLPRQNFPLMILGYQ
jgi:adenine deaminase